MNALSPLAAEMVAEDPAASSLTRSALSGVLWNWAGSAVLVVAQIASTAATARLVAPRDFGIYATAQAASGFAGYFAMAAIGSGLLRRAQLGAKTVGTAMVLSLGSALLVALVLVSGAPLWARAWGVPDAARLVRVVAFTLFLTSAATVPIALIRRRLQFRRAAIVETGTQLAGLAAGVALAVELHSALALALGQAVGAATLLVVACALARDVLRLSFDRADARELLTFSGQVGVLGLSAYAVNTAPAWFAARVFGPLVLGLYSRANLIVSLPLTYAASSMTKVLYPLYGRVRDDFARTRTLLDEALMLTTGLAWPLFALVAGAAPVVVRVLLGARWHGAAPLLAFIALAACAALPLGLLTNAAEAMGWMRAIAARQAWFAGGVAAALAAVHFAGLDLQWLLAGVAAAQWSAYGVTLQPFIRRGCVDGRAVLRSQITHAAAGIVTFGAAAGCAHGLSEVSLPIQVVAQMAIGIAVFAALFLGRSWFPATDVLIRRVRSGWNPAHARVGVAEAR